MVILLMTIGGYCGYRISGYWWILMVLNDYYINGY